jgi:hypothetical protein
VGDICPPFLFKGEIMKITDIVLKINQNLAEEQLPISRIKDLVDDVIDDINSRLSSCFPSFTDFCDQHTVDGILDTSANYNFLPALYIRQVLCKGAAYKFYVKDEEGNIAAAMFSYNYDDWLFNIERDFLELVPAIYQNTDITGAHVMSDNLNPRDNAIPLDLWSW